MDDYTSGYLSPWLRSKRFKKAQPYLKGRILDYGCGTGGLAEFCMPDFYVGFDKSQELIDRARKTHPGYCFVREISDRDKFDTIVLLAVLEHVEHPVSVLKKFKQMLNPTGHIVLTVPHPKFFGIHKTCSRIGLFSQYAGQDHKEKINHHQILTLAKDARLVVVKYSRFLFGANQLFILKHPSG
jgi:2-polyprenyl-3-methyl-5-hydroxy-6-metoxy-1,4-benzoquinol methylase